MMISGRRLIHSLTSCKKIDRLFHRIPPYALEVERSYLNVSNLRSVCRKKNAFDIPSRYIRKSLLSTKDNDTNSNLLLAKDEGNKKSFAKGKIRAENSISGLLRGLNRRQKVDLEEKILSSFLVSGSNSRNLRNIPTDPVLNTSLGSLGWIHSISFPESTKVLSLQPDEASSVDDDTVMVTIRLPTMLHPSMDSLLNIIKCRVQEILMENLKESINNPLVPSSQINVVVKTLLNKPMPFVKNLEGQDELMKTLGPGLKNVCHFVAVYSCKGGVGKSTVAVNLAYELSRMGGRVGLLDADIYGPSLPILVQPNDTTVRKSSLGPSMIMPIEHGDVKLMSLGFVNPKSGVPGSGMSREAAVMRGPMASRVVTQLLKGTDWGDLDVIVVDLPPGTGDVQLTLCQDIQFSGAVSVTTPSKLAISDALKGIQMFTSMGVPTLAMVENMAYFECEGGGKHYPFGKHSKELSSFASDIESCNVYQMPISSHANEANDKGSPLCLSRPSISSNELSIFESLANDVAGRLLQLQHGRTANDYKDIEQNLVVFNNEPSTFDVASLHLDVDNSKKSFQIRLFSESGAFQNIVSGDKLRKLHPKLGVDIESGGSLPENVEGDKTISVSKTSMSKNETICSKSKLFPCKIQKKGSYGYAIKWADGASIIYTMSSLAKLAGAKRID